MCNVFVFVAEFTLWRANARYRCLCILRWHFYGDVIAHWTTPTNRAAFSLFIWKIANREKETHSKWLMDFEQASPMLSQMRNRTIYSRLSYRMSIERYKISGILVLNIRHFELRQERNSVVKTTMKHITNVFSRLFIDAANLPIYTFNWLANKSTSKSNGRVNGCEQINAQKICGIRPCTLSINQNMNKQMTCAIVHIPFYLW